ncbi:MAG TPA: M1 family metallopeptidase [Rhodothermales bacterium]|nr:M1 family metallopeptidase [Rhodothermales bacterium]
MRPTLALVALAAALLAAPASAQQAARPVPYPVFTPPAWDAAVAAGTRTSSGEPGPNYWTNTASYTLRATLDPDAATLTGEGTIEYHNASPDTLAFIVLKLRQNLHRDDAMRNRRVYLTGGVTISRLAVGGQEAALADPAADVAPGQYEIDGTILTVIPPAPVPPGGDVTIDLGWSFQIPPAGPLAVRMGQDGQVFYLGYWYPQIAVYDDVNGWDTTPYLGLGEHYMGYADYDLTLDVPADYLVWSTGELQNPESVLTASARERLAQAMATDEIVHVVTPEEREAGGVTAPGTNGRLQWHYTTENVRDVAFTASRHTVWDATRAMVDRDGNGSRETAVLINSLYRPGVVAWDRSAEFARFSIEHLSELVGYPYPWSHMTAVEGIISGGMEYPMMTLIGGARTPRSLFGVTYHEIGHMWFPMIVGSFETAFTWMDEGLTSYNTNEGAAAFYDGSSELRPQAEAWARRSQAHYFLAGTGYAVEPMRHNDRYPVTEGPPINPAGAARGVASYSTPAVMLHALEGIVGRERFMQAYHEYARRWAFKHPQPYDFFNTMEDVLGEDLDWLWTPNFFDTWTTDHAVAGVETGRGAVAVRVGDLGRAPFPATVVVTYEDGTTQSQTVPVETWLGGAREATLSFPGGAVSRVEVDPGGYIPDVDPTNNVWPTPAPEEEDGTN